MLNTPQKHGILASGYKTGRFLSSDQTFSERYRLLGYCSPPNIRFPRAVRKKIFVTKTHCSNRNERYHAILFEHWSNYLGFKARRSLILSFVGKFCGVVVLFSGSEQFFTESIHRNVLIITASLVTASILLVQTQYRRPQLKIPGKIQISSATGVCAGGWFSGAMGLILALVTTEKIMKMSAVAKPQQNFIELLQ